MKRWGRWLFFCLALFLIHFLFGGSVASPHSRYHWPIKPPHIISGTFGELRRTHFHSGIDFSTQKRIGLAVYAVEAGFICRIKVAPDGYGNALYLRLRDGNTAVYAHLDRFSKKIGKRLWKEQRRQKKSFVDFTLEPGDLPVSRGEVIGFSGDSGEVPPHLHFELRDPKERPLNPLTHAFSIPDATVPRIKAIHLIPFDGGDPSPWLSAGKTIPVNENPASSEIHLPDQEIDASQIGIEAALVDESSGNRCAPLNVTLLVDGKVQFERAYSSFSFEEYPHPFVVYNRKLWLQKQGIFERLYTFPNGEMSFQKNHAEGRGILALNPGETKKIEIRALDAANNQSSVKFQIKRIPQEAPAAPIKLEPGWTWVSPEKSVEIHDDGKNVSLSFPAQSVYFPTPVQWRAVSTESFGTLPFQSKIYQACPEEILLRRPVSLRFSLPDPTKKRTALFRLNDDGKTWRFVKGQKREGKEIRAEIDTFGSFALIADDTAPEISNLRRETNSKTSKCLRFQVEDNLSGVDTRGIQILSGKEPLIFQVNLNKKEVSLRLDQIPKSSRSKLRLIIPDFAGNQKREEVNL